MTDHECAGVQLDVSAVRPTGAQQADGACGYASEPAESFRPAVDRRPGARSSRHWSLLATAVMAIGAVAATSAPDRQRPVATARPAAAAAPPRPAARRTPPLPHRRAGPVTHPTGQPSAAPRAGGDASCRGAKIAARRPVPAPARRLPRVRRRASLEDVISRAMPAVVRVETASGFGSGFFITPDTMLTNVHVVASNTSVTIRRPDGTTHARRASTPPRRSSTSRCSASAVPIPTSRRCRWARAPMRARDRK